jgi:Lar family restriction alleviation protein
MTNGQRFKTASERRFAYEEDIRKSGKIIGEFAWLDLEYKEELKPCPFCGGEKISTLVLHGAERKLRCNECGAQTAVFTDEKAMIDSWNRRVS